MIATPACGLTLALSVVLAGCGKAPVAPAPAPTPTPTPVTAPATGSGNAPLAGPGIPSNGGTYYVVYRAEPDPIPLNTLFSITVDVFDGAERARRPADIDLAVDGRMPEHRHGMNRKPRIVRRDDGSFLVTGMLFHMPGLWELHFDVTRGGTTERSQVDVILE